MGTLARVKKEQNVLTVQRAFEFFLEGTVPCLTKEKWVNPQNGNIAEMLAFSKVTKWRDAVASPCRSRQGI